MLLLAVVSGVWAQNETIDITAQGYKNAEKVPFVAGVNATVTFTGGTTPATYYNIGTAIRIYNGGAFTVASATKSIAKLIFTFSDTYAPTSSTLASVSAGSYDYSTNTWTSSAASGDASVTFTRVKQSSHWRLQKIDVYYAGADSRLPTTLTFATPAGFTYLQGSGTHAETNVATLDPAVAGATIVYASDNEAVATVDASGNLTVNDVPGTATISATFAGGALCVYNGNLPYTQGQILNGYAEVSYKLFNNLPEITAITLQEGATVTNGVAVPTEMSVTDVLDDANLCKYIKMTNATVSGGNVSDGTNIVKLYDTFKQSLDFTIDGNYDIVAIPIIYKTTKELAVISFSPAVTHVDVAIGETGYSTLFYSNYALQVPEGVTASTQKMVGGKLSTSKEYSVGTVIPANAAVILHGTPGNYQFAVTAENGEIDTENQLLGTDTETALDADANSYFYWLSTNAAGDPASVGFYWGAEGGAAFTNGSHKAYLKVAKSAGAKSAYLFNETTGILQIVNNCRLDMDAQMYNVAGQRVGKNYRGVVLQNGKKFILR